MVGVAAGSLKDDRSSAHNPVIKYLLKVREENAAKQEHDYSHVFRRKTRLEMLRLSTLAMAIEFAYAAETSFVSPILLQIGIDHKHMTMIWAISPLIGFFISPLLGSISDRCHLKWGRRRPIISILSIGILLGLILIPYGKELGVLLGDVPANTTIAFNSNNFSVMEGSVAALLSANDSDAAQASTIGHLEYAAILTILGMVLLDLDADTCQTPARTYVLDMCTPEDQTRAMTTFSLLAGFGGTIGYAIGGVDWEATQIGSVLGGNVPTVFGFVTIIFIVCYLITITTFREIPLRLIEKDDLLKPLSDVEIKKELSKNNNAVYYVKETTALELQMAEAETNGNRLAIMSLGNYQNGGDMKSTNILNGNHYNTNKNNNLLNRNQNKLIENNLINEKLNFAAMPTSAATPTSATAATTMSELDGDEKPVSLAQYLKSIFIMPYSMRILALTNLFCWMAHVAYCLYFTDFVGEAVFHGDPAAAPNTEAAVRYEAGVRFGCWGLSIYAFSCSMYSLSVSKLIKWFGTRFVYIAGMLYYAIGMLVLGIWPTQWGALVFSTAAGILYGTLFTIPFILVANYHAKNCFGLRNGENVPLKQKRGLGTDIAIISSMVFVAQLIVALFIGPLIVWLQTTSAILYASSILSFIAAISALFVLYV